jgi:hypothetical protein
MDAYDWVKPLGGGGWGDGMLFFGFGVSCWLFSLFFFSSSVFTTINQYWGSNA